MHLIVFSPRHTIRRATIEREAVVARYRQPIGHRFYNPPPESGRRGRSYFCASNLVNGSTPSQTADLVT